MKTYKTFQEAFVSTIRNIILKPDNISDSRNGKMYEQLGLGFKVLDASSFKFEDETIGRIDYEYAEDFYNWMTNSDEQTSTEKFLNKYPKVKGFVAKPKSKNLPENFNALYGPRIMHQLPYILEELSTNINSRRAVISILDADDLELLRAVDDPNLEFPCCDSATFNVRDGKLHMHLHMRSNNMGNVAKLDMYLWGRLMMHINNILKTELGEVTYTIVSAHVFESDFKYFIESMMFCQHQTKQSNENLLTIELFKTILLRNIDKLVENNLSLQVLRHAETENNRNRKYQGGKYTAGIEILHDTIIDFFASTKNVVKTDLEVFLKKKKSVVYTSEYQRTIQTAKSFTMLHKVNSATSALLNEFDLGVQDGQLIQHQKMLNFFSSIEENCYSTYSYGGETILEFFSRVVLFSFQLIDHHKSNENILIVGHGLWIAAFIYLSDKSDKLTSNLLQYKPVHLNSIKIC